jgi:hypothetical protein
MGTLDVKARMEYAMCSQHFLPNPRLDYCVGRLDKEKRPSPVTSLHRTGEVSGGGS